MMGDSSGFELVGMDNRKHHKRMGSIMSRRAILKSFTALDGGFALPVLAHAKPNLCHEKPCKLHHG